jgi:hypothetical protein
MTGRASSRTAAVAAGEGRHVMRASLARASSATDGTQLAPASIEIEDAELETAAREVCREVAA